MEAEPIMVKQYETPKISVELDKLIGSAFGIAMDKYVPGQHASAVFEAHKNFENGAYPHYSYLRGQYSCYVTNLVDKYPNTEPMTFAKFIGVRSSIIRDVNAALVEAIENGKFAS